MLGFCACVTLQRGAMPIVREAVIGLMTIVTEGANTASWVEMSWLLACLIL